MAEANISVDQDQFICAVCLDLLKDPVTIPCGHSFCKVCINGCWNQEDHKGIYSCPQCKATFTTRPVLRSNKMLAEVVEKLRETGIFPPFPPSEFADVECDYCDRIKHEAIKSCLTCRASFCEIHLKPHLERQTFKTHTIINATKNLQEKICTQHNKPMEIYCRTDQTCICFLCTMDRHKGHDLVTAAAERVEKQSKLKEEQIKSQQRIQEKQKKVQELKQAVNTIKIIFQTAVKDSEKIYAEMISTIKKQRSEVMELIRAREKAELSKAEQLLKQLEQEIEDLQRSDIELKQLLQTNDDVSFLKVLASRSRPSTGGTTNTQASSIPVNQHLSFDELRKCLSNVKKRLAEFCEGEFNKIRLHVEDEPELTKREEFLKYFCSLTLDLNTAHSNLSLSERKRAVTYSKKVNSYSDHPERFDYWPQVLCKESISERCYWEVEWSKWGGMDFVVSYKDINRKGWGNESGFGRNSKSWSLEFSSHSSSVSLYHNSIETVLGHPITSKIGVYVDHSAGTLSFYNVSDTMKLLHRVHTTFTQPLYAGFGFYKSVLHKTGPTVRLCNQK
ncbi:tripartite motif-containing protein 16-like isoform X1 [Clarias gariepinus]|uniref:tripartite motif-containing protein 16-like isoform X1 n=1 Tax=Clarias gariepinus TaxID=13013 RepID=UPI00234C4E4D|nr:tripartite motif-containing protein 16-like isoform X1 [Clarias gariepinus]